jgi:hypothetical protein
MLQHQSATPFRGLRVCLIRSACCGGPWIDDRVPALHERPRKPWQLPETPESLANDMGGPCVPALAHGTTAAENGEQPLGINPVFDRAERDGTSRFGHARFSIAVALAAELRGGKTHRSDRNASRPGCLSAAHPYIALSAVRSGFSRDAQGNAVDPLRRRIPDTTTAWIDYPVKVRQRSRRPASAP